MSRPKKSTGSRARATPKNKTTPRKKPSKKAPPASPSRTSTRSRIETDKAKYAAENPDNSDDEELTADLVIAAPKFRIRYTEERTERVLDWLEQNPVDRQKLFGDSTQDAAEEGRKKNVAKGNKSIFYVAIAKAVFAIDQDANLRAAVATDVAEELWKSVENFVTR
jgi:hypothetical protein